MLATVNSLASTIRLNPRFLESQKIRRISNIVGTSIQTEKISKILELYRVRYSYSDLELKEHDDLRKTLEKVSHKRFLGIGIGLHGTSSKYELAILKEIKAQMGANFGGRSQLGEGFYVGVGDNELEIAKMFSQAATDRSNLRQEIYQPVIFKIASSGFRTMKGLIIPRDHHWEKLPWKAVPSHKEYVAYFDYISSHISGFEGQYWSQVKFNACALKYLNAEKTKGGY